MESEGKREKESSPPTPLIVPSPIRPHLTGQWSPYCTRPLTPNIWPLLDPFFGWRSPFNVVGFSGPLTVPPSVTTGAFFSKVGGNASPYGGYRCTHCRAVLHSPGSFHAHLRTHMTSNCDCPICGKTFSRHWLLQGHIRTHSKYNPAKSIDFAGLVAELS